MKIGTGMTLWLQKVGGKGIWVDFLGGEESPKDTMFRTQARIYI